VSLILHRAAMDSRLDTDAGFQRIIKVSDGDACHGSALSSMIALYALLIALPVRNVDVSDITAGSLARRQPI